MALHQHAPCSWGLCSSSSIPEAPTLSGRAGQPCPSTAVAQATRRGCRLSAAASSATAPAFGLNRALLRRDIRAGAVSTEQRSDSGPIVSLAPVKDAHDQVVALLNPIAGEQMQQDLEGQIAELQHELAVAHQQVHRSEDRLQSTIDHLTELEASASRLLVEQPAADQPHSLASSSGSLQLVVEQAAPSRSSQATSSSRSEAAGAKAQPGSSRQRAAGSNQRMLHSSLDMPERLREFWYPAEFSARLKEGTMIPLELFGEPWVMFRDAEGRAACVADACAHRACPLSLGAVVDGCVQCPYHGWEYDGAGRCTKMPSTTMLKDVAVAALPVQEADGMIWVWPGRGPAPAELPQTARPPSGFTVHAELLLEVPVEHGLLLENLLDLAHAPFTHTSTFAKGWPVPDAVKFHARRLLGGHWDPYPIDMSFEPPCMVLSTIGLAQPGKIMRGARAENCTNHLHQMHVCLPAGRGRTRLLYRMSMDFLEWTRWVPGIQRFWAYIAGQVLAEDTVLVVGQQERMLAGADVWGHPVAYDKLGVRYRRWRNSLAPGGSSAERAALEAALAQPTSAGELFAPEEAEEEGDARPAGWAQGGAAA